MSANNYNLKALTSIFRLSYIGGVYLSFFFFNNKGNTIPLLKHLHFRSKTVHKLVIIMNW